jgi:hypothetical protein
LVKPGWDRKFHAIGVNGDFWREAAAHQRVVTKAFARAALSCFNLNSSRKTLAQYGPYICRTIEVMNARSQNLGHDLMTTCASCGTLSRGRRAEITPS